MSRLVIGLVLAVGFCGLVLAGSKVSGPDREQPPYGASDAEVVAARAAGCVGPQTEVNICAWSYYRESQVKLNALTGQIDAALQGNASELAAFGRSQQRWIQVRNDKCEVEGAAFHGGSAVWAVIYNCRDRLNKARLVTLAAKIRHLSPHAGK